MLTDNPVLVRKHKKLPALMCAQRKAEKRISTEADFIQSNIDSFGNDIGQTTNWVTSMYEVQSKFKEGSAEKRGNRGKSTKNSVNSQDELQEN